MPDIPNPHDRFFKEVFSRPDVAEDFLVHYLPPDVADLLQPGTFQLSKDSFIDANLKAYFSDLLYQVDFKGGEPGFIYIVFEHKSYPAADVAFQLLKYMIRIWEHVQKQATGHLPAVIPVVLYHGSALWRAPLNFASLYGAPKTLRTSLLDFTYHLCDLSAYADEEIKLGALAQVALLLLKHIYSRDLPQRLKDIFGLLRAMSDQTALEFVETVLRYLGAASATVTMDDCREAVQDTFPETGEMLMDRWTEQLVEEHKLEWLAQGMAQGLKQGLKQGMKEGMKEGMKDATSSLTIRLLRRKFGRLDTALEERIRHLTLEQLERLGEDLLDFQDESALTEWLDRIEKPR